MEILRWSDSRLRSYIDTEAGLYWFADQSDRDAERAQFRGQLRAVLVPVVQARLLELVGVVMDPDGLAMVCYDLIDDLGGRHAARRWLLVSTEPWDYLAGWVAEELVKTYKSTAGRKKPSDKVLKEIARANQ